MSNVVPIHPHAWKARIEYKQARSGEREILHVLANAVTILRNDPAWRGVLAWDELSQGVVCRSAPPWYTDPKCADDADGQYDPKRPWSETDGLRVQNWLLRRWALNIGAEAAYRAALMVTEANRFDPLTTWLNSLKWDGVKRVERFLHTHLGAEDSDYSRLVARIFFVGSVARPMAPGCKFDTMLVLEGPQGKGKSEAARCLFGDDFFRESPLDLRDKDRFLSMRGCWCREWPELDGFGKSDMNRVKSFVSARVDDFRPPYGRGYISAPRRSVLLATVNPPQLGYLLDESGNRRMLPVTCGAAGDIDFDAIKRDREQVWGEAVQMWRAGVKCYASTPEERRLCNQEQQARMVAEVWQGKIAQWLSALAPGSQVTIRQVLTECLQVPLERCDMSGSKRVGASLARLGWVVGGRGSDGQRERFYVASPTEQSDDVEREAIQAEPIH